MLPFLYYSALEAIRLPALVRRVRNAGLILCYHNVVADVEPNGDDAGLHMPLARFERQMRWLAARYTLVSLHEFVARLRARSPLGRVAAVTFDDAYAGVFTHAWPLLRHLGIPATAFIVAAAPERPEIFWWEHPTVRRAITARRRQRWLTELRGDATAILAEVAAESLAAPAPPPAPDRRPADWSIIAAAARDGLVLGAHSTRHWTLPGLAEAHLDHEVHGSRAVIAQRTGVAPEVFSYPYGRWAPRVRDVVRAAGYRAAVTLDYGLNPPAADPWALRRVNVPAAIADPAFRAWAAGLAPPLRRDGRS